jgi:hypothetical protein
MVADKELLTATVQNIAMAHALSVQNEALAAAHGFLDIVIADESESVISEADTALADATHEFLILTEEKVAKLADDLVKALAEVDALPDDFTLSGGTPEVNPNAEDPGITDDGYDGPGQYL